MYPDNSRQPLTTVAAGSNILDRRSFLTLNAGLMTGAAAMLAGATFPGASRSTLAFQEAATPIAATPAPTSDPLAGLPLTEDRAAILQEFLAFNNPPLPSLSPQQGRQIPLVGDAVVALLAKRGESTAPQPVAGIRFGRFWSCS
ncbi:hypothetical protein BH20CHL4_BH20CHL4_05310 [soil metagenome]